MAVAQYTGGSNKVVTQTWVDLNRFDLTDGTVQITYFLGRAAQYLKYTDAKGEVTIENKQVVQQRSGVGLHLHCRLGVDSSEEVWLDLLLPDIHTSGSSAEFRTVAIVTRAQGGFVPWFMREGVLQEYTCLSLKGTAVSAD